MLFVANSHALVYTGLNNLSPLASMHALSVKTESRLDNVSLACVHTRQTACTHYLLQASITLVHETAPGTNVLNANISELAITLK